MIKTCASFINCDEGKVLLFKKNGYLIKECKQCNHQFTEIDTNENHLINVYSDDYFFEGKSGYPNYIEERNLLINSGKKYARIMSRYTKPGRVLDVGSAAGFILKGFDISGWDCSGIEPNDTMATYGRNELNLNIVTQGLEDFNPVQKFDLITLIEVIGCFYDLDKALLNVSRLLEKDGLVLVESWDRKSFVARLFGKHWHEYCPPTVIHWFSNKTLNQLFSYYGFEMVAKGRPYKRITFNHGLSIIDANTSKFFLKKRILNFLKYMLGKRRMLYPPFDLRWYIFKKL